MSSITYSKNDWDNSATNNSKCDQDNGKSKNNEEHDL